MLAIDVPIALMSGMVLAEGGKNLILNEEEHKEKKLILNLVVLMYAGLFIAPAPMYYFSGWPAWELNYLWDFGDLLHDSPLRASFTFALIALTVIPTYVGLAIGRSLIKKGKEKANRIGWIVMILLVGLIVFLMRDMTFNVSSTMTKYTAGESYSFWTHPFLTGWAIYTVYFWGSLAAFYFWLKKMK